MTFSDIQTAVMDRLNLSSTDAQTRIGRFINDRYKRVTSSLGINTSRRGSASVNTVAGTATVALTMAKPEIVYIDAQDIVLDEWTFDELRSRSMTNPTSGVPREYAVQSTTGTTVTLLLFPTPSAVYAIGADGLLNASTLSGSNVPAFHEDFHDVLMFGAMADEYTKMEKTELANQAKADFEQRLSDLRFFLAKSAYLSVTQGDSQRGRRFLDNTNITIIP